MTATVEPSSKVVGTVEPSSKVITTVGPFGSEDGDAWDDGVHDSVKQLIVYSNEVVNSIQIEYEDNGQFKLANTHGSNQGTKSTVSLLIFNFFQLLIILCVSNHCTDPFFLLWLI